MFSESDDLQSAADKKISEMPNVHTRHISAMLALPTSQTGGSALPPQISAGLCHGLVALGEEPPEGSCPYCYATVTRSKEDKIGDKIKSICYRCKKVIAIKAIEELAVTLEKKKEKSPPVKLQVQDEQKGEKRSKKKRKKELNAGLTLPPTKKPAVAQSLPNTVSVERSKSSSQLAESSKSKSKLKFLMAKADPHKKGGLQDFLKKL